MKAVYVALGSNLGLSRRILSQAIQRVNRTVGHVTDCSYLYRSSAQLLTNQPDFFNAVIELRTKLEPLELLDGLKSIESDYHKSNIRFGPRELDLDIIAFQNPLEVFNENGLQIPHCRAHTRDFVVRPLCDLERGKEIVLGNGLTAFENLKSGVGDQARRTSGFEKATLIMGILNVTPDSFTDGGLYIGVDDAVRKAAEMIKDGADIIDVGGESTRPGADDVSEDDEWKRVIPVIKKLKAEHPYCTVSIDTRKVAIARGALEAGADIINDESGENNSCGSMAAVAGEFGVPIIFMHSRGDPKTMTTMKLKDDVDIVEYIKEWLNVKTKDAICNHGVSRWNVIGDPGIGFAKTEFQNLNLIARIDSLTKCFPLLVGASRKGFVKKLHRHDIDVASSAITSKCALSGVSIIRVHDVRMAVDTVQMIRAILESDPILKT